MLLSMLDNDPHEVTICNRCKIPQTREEFYSGTYSPRLCRQPCKKCFREERRKRYATQGGRGKSYKQALQERYGITLEDYDHKSLQQGNRCAICQRPESAKNKDGKPRRLTVDHDHVTGVIRGLLCTRCSLVMWALEDGHVTLPAIDSYVRQQRETFSQPESQGIL